MTICDSDGSALANNLTCYVKNANANVDAHVFGVIFSEPESDGVVHPRLRTNRLT